MFVHRSTAEKIGYGAIKYFDLSRNPTSNYIFSYDKMLDTRGNTGVYLMFAYARLKSIMGKAGVDIEALKAANTEIILEHVCERALAFELLRFSDVMVDVLDSLCPNKICEYLYSLSLCATSFVTECRVIGSDEMNSRLVMCSAVVDVMASCFKLLAIDAPEKV